MADLMLRGGNRNSSSRMLTGDTRKRTSKQTTPLFLKHSCWIHLAMSLSRRARAISLSWFLILSYSKVGANNPAVHFERQGDMVQDDGNIHAVCEIPIQQLVTDGVALLQALGVPGHVEETKERGERATYDTLGKIVSTNVLTLNGTMNMDERVFLPPLTLPGSRQKRSITTQAEENYQRVAATKAARQRERFAHLLELTTIQRRQNDERRETIRAQQIVTQKLKDDNKCENRCPRSPQLINIHDEIARLQGTLYDPTEIQLEVQEVEAARDKDIARAEAALLREQATEEELEDSIHNLESYALTLRIEGQALTIDNSPCACAWNSTKDKETFCNEWYACNFLAGGVWSCYSRYTGPNPPKGEPWSDRWAGYSNSETWARGECDDRPNRT